MVYGRLTPASHLTSLCTDEYGLTLSLIRDFQMPNVSCAVVLLIVLRGAAVVSRA